MSRRHYHWVGADGRGEGAADKVLLGGASYREKREMAATRGDVGHLHEGTGRAIRQKEG